MLLITNAKIRGKQTLQQILIENGMFTKIAENITVEGATVIDAGGNLVSPPFIDPHVHLDAVLSSGRLPRQNQSGTLLEAIDIWNEIKPSQTKDLIKAEAKRVMKWYIANGVLHVRTHADTTDPTLKTVEALIELREEMKGIVDIQVVAFPQNGIFADKDGEKLFRQSIEMGVDVVGGAPHIELTREDGVRSVTFAYELAEKYGRMVDIHIDETGDTHSRFVEVMAKENILRGFEGRAAASHTTAMHNYNNDYAFKLIGNLKRAEMNMITNPFDNSVLQNRRDGYPRGRGHTRVDELLERGVNVAIGHDSIMDPWYSMGKGSMIQGANLLMHLAHMNGAAQIPLLFDMITENAAKTMMLEDHYGIAEGKPADLVILDGRDEAEVIRLNSECLYVIRNGNILCETTPAERKVVIGETEELVTFKL